jgi:hypothetical protein
MTPDEYRIELLKDLKTCEVPAEARQWIAEAYLFLAQSRLTDRDRMEFWSSLDRDLDMLAQESIQFPDPPSAFMQFSVLTAAQVDVALHLRRLAHDERIQGTGSSS